jgi:hypothetical protein
MGDTHSTHALRVFDRWSIKGNMDDAQAKHDDAIEND